MQSQEIRKKFLTFFKERGHTIVPSSSLIPDDPSVLLTTAGMQQFKPYLTGKADPVERFGSKNVSSIQKSFRTTDIDKVGDSSHLTFFEMVGNFSFGGYFKERAIPISFEFITSPNGLRLKPERLFITAFKGDAEVPKDEDAIRLWEEQFASVGIDARIGERIFLYGREKNWWEAGIGPAGPDAEMFYDFGTPHDMKFGPTCHPNCDCGRFVEIGNDVFVQYNKTADGKYEPLKQKAIDNGRGFERLAMVMQGKRNIFETDLFTPLLHFLPEKLDEPKKRIIVDHLRASAFLLADGVRPSNKETGYILRRLLRRALVYEHKEHLPPEIMENILRITISEYGTFYPELTREKAAIINEYETERQRFSKTLRAGLKKLEQRETLSGKDAFDLYQSFGLPPEVTHELKPFDWSEFEKARGEHGTASAKGQERKFGGHGLLLDTGELKAADERELKTVTRLHTATHLLQAALRQVLGPEVKQMGSDITAVRARFDFSFPRKVTPEERKRVEGIINDIIKKNYRVVTEAMPFEEAVQRGALHFFKEKYPKNVTVYSIVHPETGEPFSRELCGGPHVKETGEIGQLSIIKEEASSAGVRRIRATVVE